MKENKIRNLDGVYTHLKDKVRVSDEPVGVSSEGRSFDFGLKDTNREYRAREDFSNNSFILLEKTEIAVIDYCETSSFTYKHNIDIEHIHEIYSTESVTQFLTFLLAFLSNEGKKLEYSYYQ